jgi:uncharacterized membrane protein
MTMTAAETHTLVLAYLAKDASALDIEERNVLEALKAQSVTSRDVGDLADDTATKWDRLADRVAAVGGSWSFITVFLAVLVGWIIINAALLGPLNRAFDPYPFIFLNLILSMIAALQAPIIMMSQNRAAAKDRLAASHDYEVNLRAELEIVRLHQRVADMHAEIRDLLRARN